MYVVLQGIQIDHVGLDSKLLSRFQRFYEYTLKVEIFQKGKLIFAEFS